MLTPKLDTILNNFHKTIDDLETFAEKSDKKSIKRQKKIEKMHSINESEQSDAFKARTVADKLKDLIGE